MKRLKVLQVINVRWYNAEADYCFKLSKSLKTAGIDLTMMGLNDSPVIVKAKDNGLRTVTNINLNSQNPVKALINFFVLKKFLIKEQFDIVNFHRSEGFIIGALACRAAKVKVIRTRGDTRLVRKGLFNRFLYNRLTDFIITSGNIIKQSIIERLECSDEKIQTIYTAVDTDFFSPEKKTKKLHDEFSIPAGSKIIAILGRLGDVKGHDLFVRAARIVKSKNKNTRFIIIGKNVKNEGLGLKKIIDELNLSDDIDFIMNLRSDIDEIVASVDVGVITSTASEANCRVAAEWMSSGVPVVSFATGVIPEVVIDKVDGMIVPTGDYEALSESICSLILKSAKLKLFSTNARESALQKFNLEKFAQDTLKVYNQVIIHD